MTFNQLVSRHKMSDGQLFEEHLREQDKARERERERSLRAKEQQPFWPARAMQPATPRGEEERNHQAGGLAASGAQGSGTGASEPEAKSPVLMDWESQHQTKNQAGHGPQATVRQPQGWGQEQSPGWGRKQSSASSGWGSQKPTWGGPPSSRPESQQESGLQQKAQSSLASFKELLQSKAARCYVSTAADVAVSTTAVPLSLGSDQANGCLGPSTEPPEESHSKPEGEPPPSNTSAQGAQGVMPPHERGELFLVATYNCNSLSRRQWDELALHSEMEDIVAVAIQEHKLDSTSALLAYTGSDLYTPWFDPCETTSLGGKAGGVGWAIRKSWEHCFQEKDLESSSPFLKWVSMSQRRPDGSLYKLYQGSGVRNRIANTLNKKLNFFLNQNFDLRPDLVHFKGRSEDRRCQN